MISGVPPARAPIAGNETVSREWYRFFQTLQVNLNEDGLRSDVDALTVRVSTLEHDQGGASSPISIRGSGSIYVSLSDIKLVSLVGDSDNPSPTAYYGTDATGGKGWYPARSLLAGATTDDLAEGRYNLYFTDARASDAAPIQSIVQGSGVTVDTTDPRRPVISATGGSSGVPYIVPDGSTYAVPLGIQALWTIPIELLGTANLDVSGHLVEVA